MLTPVPHLPESEYTNTYRTPRKLWLSELKGNTLWQLKRYMAGQKAREMVVKWLVMESLGVF